MNQVSDARNDPNAGCLRQDCSEQVQPGYDDGGFQVLVKAAVMAACGSCFEPCGPVAADGVVQCLPPEVEAKQGL